MNKKLTEMILFAAGLAIVMAVTAWFTDGVMRLILLAVLYFVEMEILAEIQRIVLNEPEKPKLTKEEKIKAEDQWYFDRQEYGKMYDMRRVGKVLFAIAIALTVLIMLTMFLSTVNPLWGILNMALSIVSVILCAVYPAYFSLLHSEEEKNRKCSFPIVNLFVPFALPLMLSFAPYQYSTGIVNWIRVAEMMLIVGAVMGAAMRLLVAECRRETGNWAVAVVMLCICLAGFVLSLNQVLEKEEPLIVSGVVKDYNRGGRRSPGTYEVLLDSGEKAEISVDRRYHDYDEGDKIELEYHQGGLGIDYYTYAD